LPFAVTRRLENTRQRIARDISATLNVLKIFRHFAPEVFDRLAAFDGWCR